MSNLIIADKQYKYYYSFHITKTIIALMGRKIYLHADTHRQIPVRTFADWNEKKPGFYR